MADLHTPAGEDAGAALEALLDWYAAMGVDAVLGDAPVDRFAQAAEERERRAARPTEAGHQSSRAAPGRPAAPGPAITGTASVPGEEVIRAAEAAAASAATLEELRANLFTFEGCNLKLTAKNLVFGGGNPAARVMLVGEAPGREEDIEGRAFAGDAGLLLDRMLAAIGLSRESDAYVGNIVYWRPPGDRELNDQEIAVCRPFVLRQIELVAPEVLVLLGGLPPKVLVGGDVARAGIRRLRGKWLTVQAGGRAIRALPTFAPAYLLRTPAEKRFAWQDLLALKAALGPGGTSSS